MLQRALPLRHAARILTRSLERSSSTIGAFFDWHHRPMIYGLLLVQLLRCFAVLSIQSIIRPRAPMKSLLIMKLKKGPIWIYSCGTLIWQAIVKFGNCPETESIPNGRHRLGLTCPHTNCAWGQLGSRSKEMANCFPIAASMSRSTGAVRQCFPPQHQILGPSPFLFEFSLGRALMTALLCAQRENKYLIVKLALLAKLKWEWWNELAR